MHEATGLGVLSPVEIVDVLLGGIAARPGGALIVEPMGRTHLLRLEHDDVARELALLPAELADAVVARLCLVAQLPIGDREGRVARIRVRLRRKGRTDGTAAELLIATRVTRYGLGAEIHRIATVAAPAGDADLEAKHADNVPHTAKYRILEVLGAGGMGTVYRAEHTVLQKQVAMKVLLPELAKDPLVASQFVVEARAACLVRHPGVVDVFDFGRLPDGRTYFVMELVDAPRLDHLLEKGPLSVEQALDVACAIADAMRAAESHGVVHRDLKPSNIFVPGPGAVKIADFGIARVTTLSSALDVEREGSVIGTAGYMSPEQARGERTDSRSDIYSFGCVLHEMLTGKLLDLAETRTQRMPTTAPATGLVPQEDLPEDLRALIAKATRATATERHANWDEVLADLRRVERAVPRGGWRRWLER